MTLPKDPKRVTHSIHKSSLRRMGWGDPHPKTPLRAAWEWYCTTVSNDVMAISLEAAIWLDDHARTLPAGASVLDLGSGFSTWVLARHGLRVHTMDTDAVWLERTLQWLQRESMAGLVTSQVWAPGDPIPVGFAFASADMGERRIRSIYYADAFRAAPVVFVDDFNDRAVSCAAYKAAHQTGKRIQELGAETRDGFGRFGALAVDL